MKYKDNRQSMSFIHAMNEVLDEAEHYVLKSRTPDVKALVTTGIDKFYSNGLEFDELLKAGSDGANLFFRHYYGPLLSRILTFPLPTIASLNGHCFAGGVMLAASHDFRAMRTDRGFYCLNEIELPAPIPSSLLALLRSKISCPRTLRDAILFGKRYNAQEALNEGLVDLIAPEQGLLESTLNFADNLPPLKDALVFQRMKKDLYQPVLQSLANEPGTDFFMGLGVSKQ
jgi:enoyl-CoA hydratase/carnithine racemase